MADNLNIDTGSTLTVATDDISGVHYQIVKIAHGALDTANQASDTTPFPVTVASATLGTVTVSLSNTKVTVDNTITASLSSTIVTSQFSSTASVVTAHLSPSTTKVTVDNTVTVTPSTTASTITNAVGNPVNVSLTSTVVTAQFSSTRSVVTAHLSPSTTKVTVDNTVTTSLSSTIVTAQISSTSSVVTAHLSPSTTKVTIDNTPTVSLSSTAVTVDNNLTLANTGVTISVGRTLTGVTGSVSATLTTLFTPTNRAKVYAFSLTTTSATELTCVFMSGDLKLWEVTLMATTGNMAGANLAVSPPSHLFASRSGTAVTLSCSSALLVHYAISLFDEA